MSEVKTLEAGGDVCREDYTSRYQNIVTPKYLVQRQNFCTKFTKTCMLLTLINFQWEIFEEVIFP